MKEFSYLRAASAAEASAALDEPGARYLGGGTNLVDLMKLGVETPSRLVDVTTITEDGFGAISGTEDGGLRIGAGVRNSDLAAHPGIRRDYPAIAQAVVAGASGQLRNLATVGGNLLQRTRCGYFTDVTSPCNKRVPGSGCPARTGEHHNHAILGASEACVATNPSDLAVALVALDAQVHARTAAGHLTMPVADLRRLPGKQPERETDLPADALLVAVTLPPPTAASRTSRYRKVRERASYAFAIGSVAASLALDEGRITEVRIAWGAVAGIPWRARVAEAALLGQRADAEAFRAAAQAELASADPLPDNAYKLDLISNLTVEVLTHLRGVAL